MRARITVLVGVGMLGWSVAAAAQPERFSLTMFHFNIQYVAGGLRGFPSGTDQREVYDLDDAEVHDLILVESFEPILDLFLAHPSWKVTLEMQAYMVEVMLERHPDMLAKLRTLVEAGQAELVSFHYSDQLLLAYPRRDLEASFELMDDVWQRSGLAPSGVVFCQEGQFGVGMLPFGAERGRGVFVLPKNLFRYQHLAEYEAAAPLYHHAGVDVVIGSRSFSTPAVEVGWSFFDDGELLATGGSAPYMGKDFRADPAALAAYEQRLEDLEAAGWRIAAIGEYVEWARANGVERRPLPPVLDGTWQPPSTDSMHRWMGASGLIDMVYGGERDNEVLTGNVRARHRILAAETLVAHAERQGWIGAGERAAELAGCWRDALLAQVTDATGINPFVGEVRYGLEHAAAAHACADALLAELAPRAGGPFVGIDPVSGEVARGDDLPGDLSRPAEPLFGPGEGFSVEAEGREVSLRWLQAGLEPGLTRLEVSIGPPAGGSQARSATIAFPLALDGFYLSPGLVEDEAVFHPFSDFDLQAGRIVLPVANGLIGLAPGLWLLKQTDRVHLGAIFEPASGVVRFNDQTLDPDAGAEWTFWLLEGDAAGALALAERLNLRPAVWIETGIAAGRGCGCASAEGRPWPLGLILLALAGRRRLSS